MKQQSLASLTYEGMKKRTKREKFLNEMEQVVPWDRLLGLIDPHYPKAGYSGGQNPGTSLSHTLLRKIVGP